jgi:signal transduction histidine kinase
MERTVLINMFDNVIAEKSNKRLVMGKETFIKAAEVRQDEVYRRLIVEVSSITHVVSESFVVKYHRSCCKRF